jgi:hypothetical protein
MTKKKAGKKSANKKSGAKGKPGNAKALELVEALDSKHESLQPVLRKLAGGEKVSDEELEALDDSDSRVSAVIPILRSIRDGAARAGTAVAIDNLDSFGAGLRPTLLALLRTGPSN